MQANEYIVTQWPSGDTVMDFWRMVSDYKLTKVIILDTVDEQVRVQIKSSGSISCIIIRKFST